jgi:AAA domain-containing protein
LKSPKAGVDDFAASGHAEADLTDLPRADVALGPECTRIADDFLFLWPDADVRIEVTTVKEHSEGVTAELAVSLAGRELNWGRLALASTPARGQLVKRLAQQHRALPWGSIIEQACRLTVQATRAGSPAILLDAQPFAGPRFLVDPFVWHTDCSFLFADGGTGKGFVALLVALVGVIGQPLAGLRSLAPTGLRVLYLDWESSAADLNDRLYRLGEGLGLNTAGLIARLGMDRPLGQDITRVRAEMARLETDFLILDSWQLACGVSRDSSGLDTAVGTFQTIRSLNRPALAIAHMSKTMADAKGAARIYGSVFNHNLSRNIWELKRDPDADSGTLLLGAYHTKINEGPRRPPFGLCFTFDGETGPVTVARAGLREGGPALLDKLSIPARILSILAPGALTIEEMAEHTGATEDTLGRTVRRLEKTRRLIKVGDARPFRWGLRA